MTHKDPQSIFSNFKKKEGQMEKVKKFALIIDGRRHLDEDHWDMVFYGSGLRPDANICIANGAEALVCLEKKVPDTPKVGVIVIWDEFQRIDGLKELYQIRNDEKNRAIPVVILSPKTIASERLSGLNTSDPIYVIEMGNPHHTDSFIEIIGELIG